MKNSSYATRCDSIIIITRNDAITTHDRTLCSMTIDYTMYYNATHISQRLNMVYIISSKGLILRSKLT